MLYILIQTCFAAPEQYDVYRERSVAGYIHIRHGCLTAKAGGDTVCDCRVEGDARLTVEERHSRLSEAVRAIHEHHGGDSGFDFRIMGET